MSKWGQAIRTAVSAMVILLFGFVCWIKGHNLGVDETYEQVWDEAYYSGQRSVVVKPCELIT